MSCYSLIIYKLYAAGCWADSVVDVLYGNPDDADALVTELNKNTVEDFKHKLQFRRLDHPEDIALLTFANNMSLFGDVLYVNGIPIVKTWHTVEHILEEHYISKRGEEMIMLGNTR